MLVFVEMKVVMIWLIIVYIFMVKIFVMKIIKLEWKVYDEYDSDYNRIVVNLNI